MTQTLYCTDAQIDDIFGKKNIDNWADLDRDRDPVKIIARRLRARERASAGLEDEFRGGVYTIPFVGTSETLIDLCVRKAGVWLYDNMGIEHHDDEGNRIDLLSGHRKQIKETVRRIKTGDLRLPLTRETTDLPAVVPVTLAEESST